MEKSKLLRYLFPFIAGVTLGFLYLWFFQPQTLGLSRRTHLKSGSVWTGEKAATETIIPEPTKEPKLSIIFAGDLMLDRHVRLKAESDGYDSLLGESLKELLINSNLVIANLEGPITQSTSKSVGSEVGSTNNFIFTFAPESAEFLSKHNIKLVNLGNNHIANFGKEGVISTLNYLYQGGIEHFGWVASSPDFEEYNQEYLIIEVSGYLLGFVNFNQFSNQQFTDALETVEDLRPQVEYLTVYTHWGTEYAPKPNQVIKDQAHQLIDAGADLVIGSHPHVIQPSEEYQQGKIYYSLGNFIFDQYFSPEVKKGQLVELELERVLDEKGEEILADTFGEYEVLMSSGEAVKLFDGEISQLTTD